MPRRKKPQPTQPTRPQRPLGVQRMPERDNAAQRKSKPRPRPQANEALDDEVDDDAEEEEEQAPPLRDVEEQAMFASYRPFTSVGRPHPAPLRSARSPSTRPSRARSSQQLVAPAVLSNKGLSNASWTPWHGLKARLQMNRGFLIADSSTGKGRGRLAPRSTSSSPRFVPDLRAVRVGRSGLPSASAMQRRSASSCHCTTRALKHHDAIKTASSL